MCRKKEIQFLFRLGLNAIKRLRCNANIQMFSAFQISSITVNLHSQNSILYYMYLCCVGTKYFQYYCNVPVHQRKTRVELQDHQFVCRLHRFFSLLLRGRKKNSSKSHDLDRNMLVWVFLKLLQLLICYLNTMADPSFQHIATCLSKAVDLLEPQSKSR